MAIGRPKKREIVLGESERAALETLAASLAAAQPCSPRQDHPGLGRRRAEQRHRPTIGPHRRDRRALAQAMVRLRPTGTLRRGAAWEAPHGG